MNARNLLPKSVSDIQYVHLRRWGYIPKEVSTIGQAFFQKIIARLGAPEKNRPISQLQHRTLELYGYYDGLEDFTDDHARIAISRFLLAHPDEDPRFVRAFKAYLKKTGSQGTNYQDLDAGFETAEPALPEYEQRQQGRTKPLEITPLPPLAEPTAAVAKSPEPTSEYAGPVQAISEAYNRAHEGVFGSKTTEKLTPAVLKRIYDAIKTEAQACGSIARAGERLSRAATYYVAAHDHRGFPVTLDALFSDPAGKRAFLLTEALQHGQAFDMRLHQLMAQGMTLEEARRAKHREYDPASAHQYDYSHYMQEHFYPLYHTCRAHPKNIDRGWSHSDAFNAYLKPVFRSGYSASKEEVDAAIAFCKAELDRFDALVA